MKELIIHADEVSYKVTEETDVAEEISDDEEEGSFEDILFVRIAVEKEDEKDIDDVADKAVEDLLEVLEKIGIEKVLLYPYVHLLLGSKPASPDKCIELLKAMESKLDEKNIWVKRAPFGFYKKFNVSAKGHPLSELSREIEPGESKETEEEELSEVEEDGTLENIKVILEEGKIKERDEVEDDRVERAIRAELGELNTGGEEPPHISLMKRLELVENESRISDSGNMRYYPKGQLIIDLMMDLGERICTQELNGVKTKTPCIVDPNQENVKIMMEKFPERLYKVMSPDKDDEFRLRPACDYGAWSMMKDMVISYKQLPIGLYEHDLIWRYEQSGELVGLNRLRNSTMADFHTLCKDTEESFEEFEKQVNKFAIKLYDYFGIDPEIVVLNCKKDFFEKHKETFKSWTDTFDMPIIVKLFKSMKTYKVAWVDVIAFDELDRPVEVDTVQLDTESPKWWDITYTTEEGEEEHPLILHTGFGPERFLSAILEDASAKDDPTLPLWLSPTQLRIIPVSPENHMDYCTNLLEELEKSRIRVDIDDRNESVGRRIRSSEREWVPYTLVVGDDEIGGENLSVRKRESGEEESMELEELVDEIKDRVEGYPFKPLPLPRKLSERPNFVG